MVDLTPSLPGLSPVAGKEPVARFDGGRLSSGGGLLVLREIERRLKVADRLAACLDDPRDPGSTVHPLADIIRFRMLMIAAGLKSRSQALAERGYDAEQVDAEIAADQARERTLGLSFGASASAPDAATAEEDDAAPEPSNVTTG